MAANTWNYYKLLMWKNFLIKFRHKKELTLEIVVPILFSCTLLAIRGLNFPEVVDTATVYKPQDLGPMTKLELNPDIKRWAIEFTPNHYRIETLIRHAADRYGGKPLDIGGHASAEDLQRFMRTNESLVGVVFDASIQELDQGYPKNLKFTLRFPALLRTTMGSAKLTWSTKNLFPVQLSQGPRNQEIDDGGLPPGYIPEGFAPIQKLISEAYVALAAGDENLQLPDVKAQRFPYKPYIEDNVTMALEIMVSFIVLLCFVYPCIQAVKHITIEKETQLKEAMKIMGLSTALNWTAWFCTLWLCLVVTVICIVCIMKIPFFDNSTLAVLTNTSSSLLFVYLVLYITGMVTFSFMISSFFSKANVAGAISGLAWFALYIPYSFTFNNFFSLTLGSKLAFSLFLNTGMSFGFKTIINWEMVGVGAQWGNLFDTVNMEDDLTLGYIMIMMVVDAILYMLITLYLEKVMPGNSGRLYKWYFPLMPSFWCPSRNNSVETDFVAPIEEPDKFEPEVGLGRVGLKLLNLKKKFGEKLVVDGVTLNLYEGQITALLGHNGAGKTTTISMITGLLTPTSGTAIVNDTDISKNLSKARKLLGFCPQYNILFNELTVKEHIIFFSRLKGLNNAEVKEEVDKYLKVLNFEDKRNAQAKTLSGGMKRKLSVGVALCGRSKVVLCDEPSAGMDPAARRDLWDLIMAEKRGRTILLTTHFMDEADILGDRVAIMSAGKLQCSGTPFFLKKRFGTGYQLICSKKSDCNTEDVTALVRKYIPEIQVKADVGSELSYNLSEKYANLFEQLLKELEDSQQKLRINGYGVSMTTLEDVFMKTGSEVMDAEGSNKTSKNGSIASIEAFGDSKATINVEHNMDTVDVVSGIKKTQYQWKAMFLKKLYNFKHNWYIFLMQILIPVFLLLITLNIPTEDELSDLPSLEITLDSYASTVTLLERTDDSSIGANYQQMFESFGESNTLESVTGVSMTDRILGEQEKDLLRVNSKFLVAATINNSMNIAWFNNEGYHTVPLALNMIYNAIARAHLGPDYSIEVTNAPLPLSVETEIDQLNAVGGLAFQISVNLSFAMAFVSGIFVLFMIKERVSRSKLLQFVSGVRLLTFWFVHFIWDFLVNAIVAVVMIILLLIFAPEGFATSDELGRAFMLFLLYGFGSMPLTYLFSLVFDSPTTGMSLLIMLNIFTGNALFVTTYFLSAPGMSSNEAVTNALRIIGYFFPCFSLAQGLANQASLGALKGVCANGAETLNTTVEELCTLNLYPPCCNLDPFAWSEPGLGQVILALILVGIILFVVLLVAESRSYFMGSLKMMGRNKALPPLSEDGYIDDDVQNERLKVQTLPSKQVAEYSLVMQGVTKYYKNLLAVNQLSVAIDKGECFGLLGVNGAGKTTTFKMLTGDETISHGNIWVKGYDVEKDRFKVYEMIGYCPQFDGLLDDFTGYETIQIYSLLRGIPNYMIRKMTRRLAKDLAFDKHLNKKAKEYSGGNRRKLSTAIAILGNPYVIFLDEPTAGIDPASRRKLWDMICHIRDIGKAIVLTSHSMEECEALCTRIAIMVNGEFKCLGSTQHLKNKFAQGISLIIKLEATTEMNGYVPKLSRTMSNGSASVSQLNESCLAVQRFMTEHFRGAVLKDYHQNYITFEIPSNVMPYSQIFGLMEANKAALHIEDYSLSQATLEQIFLDFAQKQRTAEEENLKKKSKKKK